MSNPRGREWPDQLELPVGDPENMKLTRTPRVKLGDAQSVDERRSDIPVVLDVPQAAHLLGIGRTLAYELVRTDQWPTPVIRIGRLIRIPSGPLLELITTGATRGRRVAG